MRRSIQSTAIRLGRRARLGALALALALLACGGTSAEPAPTLTVTMPSANASIAAGSTFKLAVTVTNFTFEPVGTANAPNQGHMHIYLDSQPSYIGLVAAAEGTVVLPTAVAAGAHMLAVSLRNNDHTPLDPPVQATVAISVP